MHVERVRASVLDLGSDQPGNGGEAGAALKPYAGASTHPVDVLLIVDRDNVPRTAGFRKEAVEAVKRAYVKHAAARETIRAEHSPVPRLRSRPRAIAHGTWVWLPRHFPITNDGHRLRRLVHGRSLLLRVGGVREQQS